MAKRKLTDQQTQRIAASHQQRTTEKNQHDQDGTLISRFGANALVANTDWQFFTCHIRQNVPDPVPGDHVIWQQQTIDTGVITAVHPRTTTLNRVTYQGEQKPVAANITLMIITISAIPAPSSELIDRYIIAAENLGFEILILVNKSDLAETEATQPLIKIYQDLGYSVLYASATENSGIDALQQQLCDKTSIFIGQSGVGKSSLVQILLPDEKLRIGEISEKQHGRHTTTTTVLYRIETGGYLIDSPGVRQFRLWHATPNEIMRGYKEIAAASNHCQFRNCAHQNETRCGVKAALEKNEIHPDRFTNWQRITLNP